MMIIMGKRFSRRGVSVIIAALLLIAISVAAAVLLYVFSIGLMGSLQGGGGQQVKQQLIMSAYNWNTLAAPTFSMRNVGAVIVVVGDVFVNGVGVPPTQWGVSGTGCNSPASTIPVQVSCVIALSAFGAGTFGTATGPTSGITYTLKVISMGGGVFSYSAVAGRSS